MITISNEEFERIDHETRDINHINQQLQLAREQANINDIKVIILDDDPTGTQTVHDVAVYTSWDSETIYDIFSSDAPMAFILTNSRSFSEDKTVHVHREIADSINTISKQLNIPFIIISRSDSTLRGHYPIETEALRDIMEASDQKIHGEILCPYFKEGNRFTINNIHFIKEVDGLIAVSDSDYAKDKTFGYKHSHLGEWCEEKTQGRYQKENLIYITLDELKKTSYDCIQKKLEACINFNKIIVNATNENDLKVFITAYLRALNHGYQFIFRSAAAIPKILGNCMDIPYLNKNNLIKIDNKNGGLIVVGSHVNRTTSQLKQLEVFDGNLVTMIEFNQHLILGNHFDEEIDRVIKKAETTITQGKTAVIFTKRERIDLPNGNREEQLQLAVQISDAIVKIISKIKIRPSYILSKGGITSSDIAVKALNIKKAYVLGQIKPAVPVWYAENSSKFNDLHLIIFPGNVGNDDTLKEIVELLA